MKKIILLCFFTITSLIFLKETQARVQIERHYTSHYYFVDGVRYDLILYENMETKKPVFSLSFGQKIDEFGIEETSSSSFNEEELEYIKNIINLITEGKSFSDCGNYMLIGIQTLIWELWSTKTGNIITYQFDVAYNRTYKKKVDELLKTYYNPKIYEYNAFVNEPLTISFLPFLEEEYNIIAPKNISVTKEKNSFTITSSESSDKTLKISSTYFQEEVSYYQYQETEFLELKKGRKPPIEIFLHTLNRPIINHHIEIISKEGVTHNIPKTSSKGATISLDYQLKEGYVLDSISIISSTGKINLVDQTFIMPDSDITIFFETHKKENPLHSIITLNDDHVVINSIKSAQEGEIITYNINCEKDYELSSFKIYTIDYEEITFKDNSFIMPNKPVIIEARTKKIEKKHSIKIISNHAKVFIDSTFEVGKKVKFTLKEEEGYEVKYIKITTSKEEIIPINNEFIMPDDSISIEVVTKKILEQKYFIYVVPSSGIKLKIQNTASKNEIVTFSYLLEENYHLDTLKIISKNGQELPVNNKSFIMPENDILIIATSSEIKTYPIIFLKNEGINLDIAKKASFKEKVFFSYQLEKGYTLEKFLIKTFSGQELFLTSNSFIMPEDGVIVTPIMKEKISFPVPNTYSENKIIFLLLFFLILFTFSRTV